jgi:membrane protein implicated in regulation of membrane protease activity
VLRAVASGLGFALVPKCPLCLAAYLSALGVGAGVAAPIAVLLRPALLVVAAIAAVVSVAQLARHARRARAPHG